MDHTDARGIPQHLGHCRQGTDETWGYSCPRLEVSDIGATNEKVERDDIDNFISGRYGDGEPFYQGTYLVTRPPDLVDLVIPSHLEEDLDVEELEESDSMEMESSFHGALFGLMYGQLLMSHEADYRNPVCLNS
ncbi:hypothetical protein M407DRAFT_21284 [Tulasnella calospora MUT 4182]|uniref:Uncharacterized protein n=1 Tax=Tulasnella calospora MUT 4182 TaxID=1051891 RepID=A0A0C3QEE5_9AGAM|nr:hypothetical protein M407DRAFT_21284 [Tulasnella calospora MUT 4182]